MGGLSPEAREAVERIESELMRVAEESVGRPADERTLGALAGAARTRWQTVGFEDVEVDARYIWSCQEVLLADCTCEFTPEEVEAAASPWHREGCPQEEEPLDCTHYLERPTWRNPLRLLRLRLTGSPGRCRWHGTRLYEVAWLELRGRFHRPVERVLSTVRVA